MIPGKTGGDLRAALLIRVVLPVFLILALLLAIAFEFIASAAEGRLQRDLRQVARAVQLPVAQALERNDIDQLASSLASVFEISEVYGAYVFNAEGERLAAFGSVRPSRIQSPRIVEQTVNIEREFDQYESIDGRDVYSFFMPLFDTAGRPNGLLQATRRRSDIEAELTLLRTWAWTGFGVVLTLMLGSLMLTHHRVIGKPLTQLLNSMRRVKEGDQAHRAASEGPSEIRQLADNLNSMLDAIHEAEYQAMTEMRARQSMAGKLRHAESMALLGQLSAGVAHELGAPLSVVDGRAARLLRDCADPNARQELETIREQVQRMSTLVEQLLSFGRNSRSPMSRLRLEELVGRVRKRVAEEGKAVDLRPGPQVQVRGDLLSLEQALMNLLRNAWQACPEGQVRLGWYRRDAANVAVFVEDSGPGIDGEFKAQVFEPFVTSKLPGEGSGMGLAIVQRVTRDHDGEVYVDESELGGARFTLVLPILGDEDG